MLPSTTASTADQPVESVDTTVVMATSTSDSTSTVATAVGIIGPPVDTKSVTIDFEVHKNVSLTNLLVIGVKITCSNEINYWWYLEWSISVMAT